MTATNVRVQMQQRSDTAANWTAAGPTLLAGEIGYETDTGKIKIGDGTTAWASLAYLPIPDSTGELDDDLTITGDLTVQGTTTTIESTTLTIEDKNIELAVVDTPTDVTADGGGITLKGTTDKTINWVDATDAWTFSEHVDLASAKEFRIDGTKVLDATGLGSAVVSSSLTSVGTIGTGVWEGTAIDAAYLDSTVVTTNDIGVTVQGYDADTAKYDDTTANFTGTLQQGSSDVVVDSDIGVTVQGYDADTAKLDVAQTFTAVQTLTDPAIIGTILEDVYTISDGAAFEVDPGNGSVQLITLGANRTPKATNFAAGESITLMVDDGSAYTLTWTDTTWGTSGVVWTGGSAPTLATSGYTVIQFWKVGSQVYGATVGDVA